MKRSKEEKQQARIRNLKANADFRLAFTRFIEQLKSEDTVCLDKQHCDELVDIRYMVLKELPFVCHVVDDGIRSITGQSVSGRCSRGS